MEKKIVGIVYAYDAKDEYDMVKELGIRWMRMPISFPWADRMYGGLSEAYTRERREMAEAHENGMKIMPATPPMGGFFYDPMQDRSYWHESFPDFVGEKGTEAYYENLRRAMKFVAEDIRGISDGLWQIMNEIDIKTFSNEYPLSVIAGTARACAQGIVAADPSARCGINLSRYHEQGLIVADEVYKGDHPFAYIGDDQYFGSWQGRNVEAWTEVIDALYARYQLPVLINEWGYSSGGALAPERPDPADIPEGWTDVCHLKRWFHDVPGGHTEAVQAEYLRRGLEIFANHPHVLGSFLFCWRDAAHCYHCGQSECPAECYWGIVDQDANPKPAYHAVKRAIAEYY